MAHSCPECGLICHCGGDIDDCCFEGTPEERACGHCPIDGYDDDEPDFTSDPDDPTHPGWQPMAAMNSMQHLIAAQRCENGHHCRCRFEVTPTDILQNSGDCCVHGEGRVR